MATAVNGPADIVNLALVRLGNKNRIGSIWDGSTEAKVALDCYSQTRDALLRDGDYGFAERNIVMTLLKQAPSYGYVPPATWSNAYPPLPWNFEYFYPEDCLKIRALKPQSIFVQDFDPQPVVFRELNDNGFTPPKKVICCNVPNALLTYTAQVTDPTTWEASFIEEFAAALARRMAIGLANIEVAKMETADEISEKQTADHTQG